jgi:hypothetical protein
MVDLTKAIGAVAASVAALGGSYTLADKFGLRVVQYPRHANLTFMLNN